MGRSSRRVSNASAHRERQRHATKQRVLTHVSPSRVRSIADALVIKDGDVFFVTDAVGMIPTSGEHGFGLYYHDCRYLHGYELLLGDTHPDMLAASASEGSTLRMQLTNAELAFTDGSTVPKERIGIRWDRVVDGQVLALHETLTFRDSGVEPLHLPVTLSFSTGFEDIFVVRGMLSDAPPNESLGRIVRHEWSRDSLTVVYEGSDGRSRTLIVRLDPAPQRTYAMTASFDLQLAPQAETMLRIALLLRESDETDHGDRHSGNDAPQPSRAEARDAHDAAATLPKVSTDDRRLLTVIRRGLLDLRMLRTELRNCTFYAAGIPWFVTLFGRDSLIAALQTLAFDPTIARETLRLLASYQGRVVDRWKEEEPGKIPHELRVGELARRGEIPYTPYYGSVDATPLFLVLAAQYTAWTGDLTLFTELRDAIERALSWIAHNIDAGGRGYVEYESDTTHGLVNQGWKDSGDAIINADGSLADPPIALVEVQGYVYLAKRSLADLFDATGDGARATALRAEAAALRERFNRDFWLADRGTYALALQKGGRPAAVCSSNPGHALWTGIVAEEHASHVHERLMAPDMFSGWGVRTLAERELRYNPIGYHLGTVWPHDNSIIAAGFRRYGFDADALRICRGIVDAASHFDHDRLPEVFAGYPSDRLGIPVRYPVACHPQAWAAGSVPFLLQTVLGLSPDALQKRLRIVHPLLPETAQLLELRGLTIGGAQVDLRFERARTDGTQAEVLDVRGDLHVEIETPDESGAH